MSFFYKVCLGLTIYICQPNILLLVMENIRHLLLTVATICLSALFGASLFESVAFAPNLRVNIPHSLEHARLFMKATNPGHFFQVAAPLAVVFLLLSMIGYWRQTGLRWLILAALACVVVADIVTFTFHYPRNAILFSAPMNTPVATLEKAAAEWSNGNYVRVALALMALICALIAGNRASTRYVAHKRAVALRSITA